jgi:pimeloyl-ACP methyl ester carboxylesterase
MEEKYINSGGAAICYRMIGHGTPVVLLHGFAEDGTIWNEQAAFLSNHCRLIIPDIPGSGKSTALKKEPVGLEDYAACLKEILSAEGIEHCVMIGHSMGGYITLAFAEKYPEYLKAIGLFHSSAYADDMEKIETRKKAIAFIEDKGPAAFLKTSIPALFYDPEKNKSAIEALLQKGNDFTADALIEYYRAMIARPDRTVVLKNAPIPVLFIMGEHDKAVPFKHSLEQSYMPAKSHIHILRNSAHMGMLEETKKANHFLGEFLQANGVN